MIFCVLPYSLIIRRNRKGGKHGGLLLAAHSSFLQMFELLEAKIDDFCLSCLFSNSTSNFEVILSYLPPRGSNYFIPTSTAGGCIVERFNEITQAAATSPKDLSVAILGDFNFPHINCEECTARTADEQCLLDSLTQDLLLEQIIRTPTHRKGINLDLVFVTHSDAYDYEILDFPLSDHNPVLLNNNFKPIPLSTFSSQFSTYTSNQDLFKSSVCSLHVSLFSADENFAETWLTELLNLVSYCLVRNRRKRKQYPFFYSSLTMHTINKLETARRQKCSSTKLEKLENDVKIFIDLDKMSFIESTKNFTINAFKMLKCLGGRNSLPNKMNYFESSAMSDLEKANLFIFFHSVYKKYSTPTSAPNETESSDIQLSDLLVTPAQVGILLENVPPSTMAVADGIPPFVLKNCEVTLAPLVHLVFSDILSLRKWPTIWKCSFITPIHKKESKNRAENYRPISILPRLSLILEKILLDFLYSKFHCILSNRQHGFRKEHSAITQLLVFLDEIYTNYGKNVEITLERDLRFFISIMLGKTCIKFEDFFTLKINSRMLRSEHANQLVINPTIKQLTSKSYFKRVQVYVNILTRWDLSIF